MATLTMHPDSAVTLAGWTIVSEHPGALAAIPDAIVQHLGFPYDVVTLWARHPSEQDGSRDAAYLQEQQEIGPASSIEVVELTRPHQRNVVWTDRYHLIAAGARATAASRIAGMYAGERHTNFGSHLVTWIHDPSVTTLVADQAYRMPAANGGGWDFDQVVLSCRFALNFDARYPTAVTLRCPPLLAPQIAAALTELATLVSSW